MVSNHHSSVCVAASPDVARRRGLECCVTHASNCSARCNLRESEALSHHQPTHYQQENTINNCHKRLPPLHITAATAPYAADQDIYYPYIMELSSLFSSDRNYFSNFLVKIDYHLVGACEEIPDINCIVPC